MRVILILILCFGLFSGKLQAQNIDFDKPRPIEALDTVFIGKMTWMEVRDAIKAGKKTALIPTGGVEDNGPYLALDKHNIILEVVTERLARRLGNTLIAPIVGFVPEGDFEPKSGHMRYPGTIGVSQETFDALLTDIALSLKASGFHNIILLGDSGGNRIGMERVTKALNKRWEDEEIRAHYIPEYYDNPLWGKWLDDRGVAFESEGIHDDFRHSSIMMLADPESVRIKQRKKAGLTSINGQDLLPIEETLKIASDLVDFQVDITAKAIKKSLEN
ncbi:MAG: creatininase family protein [Sphingomonadales bacterium]|jgi:creatinine amidohydrolase